MPVTVEEVTEQLTSVEYVMVLTSACCRLVAEEHRKHQEVKSLGGGVTSLSCHRRYSKCVVMSFKSSPKGRDRLRSDLLI